MPGTVKDLMTLIGEENTRMNETTAELQAFVQYILNLVLGSRLPVCKIQWENM